MSTLKQRAGVVQPTAYVPNFPAPEKQVQAPVGAAVANTVPQQQQQGQHNGPHPPGYNKHKRDKVKMILLIVALALLSGDSIVPTMGSAAAIITLKEGTFWSAKNLKWMALCTISFVASLISWSLLRHSHHADEEQMYSLDSMLWVSAKIIQMCWGVTLSVFLCSAFVHGHNSLLEFDFHVKHMDPDKMPPMPAGPRKDPPPKKMMIY